jgi:hypothetical protein
MKTQKLNKKTKMTSKESDFQVACKQNDLKTVKDIITERLGNKNWRYFEYDMEDGFHLACKNGCYEVIDYFFKDVFTNSYDSDTIEWAAYYLAKHGRGPRHFDYIESLIKMYPGKDHYESNKWMIESFVEGLLCNIEELCEQPGLLHDIIRNFELAQTYADTQMYQKIINHPDYRIIIQKCREYILGELRKTLPKIGVTSDFAETITEFVVG